MKLPLQISFHNTESIPAVEQAIRERATRLDRYYGQIMSCRVVVDIPHRHHHTGNLYQVRIGLRWG
jgi:hypothetical protein